MGDCICRMRMLILLTIYKANLDRRWLHNRSTEIVRFCKRDLGCTFYCCIGVAYIYVTMKYERAGVEKDALHCTFGDRIAAVNGGFEALRAEYGNYKMSWNFSWAGLG